MWQGTKTENGVTADSSPIRSWFAPKLNVTRRFRHSGVYEVSAKAGRSKSAGPAASAFEGTTAPARPVVNEIGHSAGKRMLLCYNILRRHRRLTY